MFSTKSLKLIRIYRPIHPIIRKQFNATDIKFFSLSSKLCKEESKKELTELEQQLKKIMSEYVDLSSPSPFAGFINRWLSKPWIHFFGDDVRDIQIKERKNSELKDGMFRMAFDLAGFNPQEIRILLSRTKLYIEAKKEESTTDGNKSWREYAYECRISADVDKDSVSAYLDSGGLLIIEGDLPKETLTGMRKPKPKK